jgi:MoaA/NifB/PqqE/SkfB family radical SAM enzyme
MDLTKPGRLYEAQVEFTTNCNLKCTYCALSQPWYQGKAPYYGETKDRRIDLKIDTDKLIETLKRRNTKTINIHGHGETTILPDWHITARKFLNAGFDVIICTNLIKKFTAEECQILSELYSITVSLDSIDQKTFKELRGGDIRQLIYNMTRIKAIAEENSLYQRWIWSVVVLDKSLPGLMDLVKMGLVLGVEAFCFCDFYKEDIETTAQGVKDLTPQQRRSANKIIKEVQEYCVMHGAKFMTSLDGAEEFSRRGYL